MEFNIDKSNWKKVKLGSVAFEYSKRINNPSESEFDRFVGSSNIAQWDFRVRSWKETDSVTSAMKLFEPNDYLLVRRSLYASDFRERAPRAHFSGVCSGDILTIKENPDFIIDGFLIGIFNSPALWKFVVANASGSITRRIKWKNLANYEFLLPPKDQQDHLAKLLWAMDEMIEKEKEVWEKTEIIKQSLFKKFTSQGESWRKFKIKELMGFNYGSALKESNRIEGDYSVITSSGYQGSHNEYKIEGPGIVVGRKGNVGQVTWVTKNFWATDTAYFITINEDFKHIPFKFFYYLLIASNLKKHSIATAVPGLNRDDALLTKIYLPDDDTIEDYLVKFNALDDKLIDIETKIGSSQSLQKSLINQVF
jgi:restriction endonuclease S subunit